MALENINHAVSFGERNDFYYDRAKIYAFDLENDVKALEDINHAIELRPAVYDYHYNRMRFCFALRLYDKALYNLKTIDTVWPRRSSTEK